MTIAATIANEYLSWERTEAVSLKQRRNGTDTDTNIAYAARGNLGVARRNFGEVQLGIDDEVWIIPSALIASGTIRPGDFITDASSVKWTVQNVRRVKMDTQFICLTVKQR